MALDGARSFQLFAKLEKGQPKFYWDAHSLDEQRFYDTVCLIYGHNPDKYHNLFVPGRLPASGWLLGRVYFDLAAMRFHSVDGSKMLRREHAGTVFVAGLFIAGFVLIPIVNLATPLFGTAFMVHMHKRLTRTRQADLLAPVRGSPR